MRVLTIKRQGGAVLLLVIFIIALAATAYVMKSFDAESLRSAEDEKTYKALAEAKEALIAWSVSHPSVPGMMPYPDRNSDAEGYDGLSDCPGGVTNFSHLLGRLPWKGADYTNCNNNNLLPGLGKEFRDGSNEPLWYAVSKNLVHIYSPAGDPIINPSIVDNPPYGSWLTVYDKNGNLISDKVAVVIISPGAPIGGQNRSASAPAPAEYLDSFNIGAAIKSNTGYTLVDEDFYMGEDFRSVPATGTTYGQPYYFNDKIVFITINELLDAVQRRAGEQAKASLKGYYQAYGYYPYASEIDAVTGKKYCVPNKFSGALPINTAPTVGYACNYSRTSTTASTATCGFDKVSSIAFTRASSSFTISTTVGQCAVSSSVTTSSDRRVCTCTGAGSCSNGTQKFECTSAGECTTTGITGGTYTFSGGVFSSVTPSSACSASCVAGKTQAIACTSIIGSSNFQYDACGDADFGSFLPTWFTNNNWQDYIYYQMTRPADNNGLSAGAKKGAAVVVAVGPTVLTAPFTIKAVAQVRPSCSLNDYLDTTENTNLDNLFEATNKSRAPNYNDQVFLMTTP